MFSNKEFLYINAIKYDTQLKLDYKQLNSDEITKNKNYVHLVNDEILSKDIAHKINLSQEENPYTYISTLLIKDTAQLVPKNKQIKSNDFELCAFNNEYNIAIAKTTLFETKHYFNKTGIDYIYSAYHILNLHMEQNVCKNELLVFLFNNKAFLLVVDNNSSIVFSNSIKLPSFEEVNKSKFYEDDVVGQKLYDEIYYLELSEIIEDNLNEFYKNSKDTFVEKITILYAVKQLEKEQIDALKEELLLEVEYHPISVEEEIFELSKDKHQKKSFIRPRKKEKNSNTLLYFLIFVLLILIALVFYNFYDSTKNEKVVQKTQTKIIKEQSSKLPNHVNINNLVDEKIKSLFNAIPYDVVLKGMTIYENSVKLNIKLLKEDTYIKSLEPELKNIFKKVSISIKDENKKISQDGIVLANKYIRDFKIINSKNTKYITDEFLPKNRVIEQLKVLLPKNSIIKLKKSINKEHISFEYYVNIVLNEPKEFFTLIKTINEELYSIYINYPIEMNNINGKIEVEFNLVFNQPSN